MSPQNRANFDPAQSSVLGVALLGQLVIVVFGALMLTSEYSTGSMRTSLTVMPRRTVLYGAKLAVFAAISLGVAVVTSLGAFFLGQALLGSTHAAVSLAHPGALRSVVITALYAEVCGLIAFGVGALVRNTADTLAALTPREREVLSLIAQGRSNAAIAGTLFISPKVVEKHVASIFDKLGLPPSDTDNRRVIAAIRYLES